MTLFSLWALPFTQEGFWFIFALIQFLMLLITYRLFGKTGLLVWIGFTTIIANIQVVKTVELFGIVATLGNITYGTIFLATDLLNEKYGKEEARRGVMVGFFALVLMTIIMQLALLFPPSADGAEVQDAFATIFGLQWRIALGSLAAFLVSQWIDVGLYHFLKIMTGGKRLWLRNNVSTMISQLLDTLVFCSIAFLGTMPASVWWQIFVSTYVLKFIVAFIDTPFLYWARRLKVKSS
ncbi:queuosine precursor transporter [Bacillaceae bacterium SIJ1]|uniref:queuosine precursor transporter n=1 Tax=Litoribacterium kuwaitense TaxID=1398745 RepID=UPI0013EAC48B|nr:queuosine precursor transporter [Litoribacterium kuwaitense]NGP44674.1 queuosine precursor transporter [Litoribacterium kuwaitense]